MSKSGIEKIDRTASIMALADSRIIIGRTRLQKMFCLLDLAGINTGFEFTYRYYGPYSEELRDVVNGVCAFGLAKEEIMQTNWASYSKYTINKNVDEAESGDICKKIVQICTNANTNAIALELATTAAWLKHSGESEPWGKVEELKSEKSEQIGAAKELYKKLKEADKENRLPTLEN